MRLIKFILQMTRPYRRYLFGMFITMSLGTVAKTLKWYLIKKIIDTISENSTTDVWQTFFAYSILGLINVTAWTLWDYCLIKHAASLRLDIVHYFMRRLYDGTYDFFQSQLVGSLSSKVNDAFQHLPHLVFIMLETFTHFLILIIISASLLTAVAPLFAVTMVIWVCTFFFITFFQLKKGKHLHEHYAEEKSNIIGAIADYLSNIVSVKAFTAKKFEFERFSRLREPFLTAAHRQATYFMWFYALQGIVTAVYSVAFIALLIMSYQKGCIGPGDFALVVMTNLGIIDLIYQVSHTLREFVAYWGLVNHAITLAEKVPQLVDKPEERVLQLERGGITFDTVSFQYHYSTPIFQNLSTTIVAGQKVGLVGYSGGGKSTFVSLILRLFDVTAGRILIDGQDIRDVTQDSLRQQIGVIPQDPALFHRTLMENIRYGAIRATDEAVIAAAKKAHAHHFISKLPQGYASLVGERGIKLSGGQRQRIAIARVILKNAPILILDEATSQLDSLTERKIQRSLWTLMQHKTTLVIAHRLSTLLQMDRILVFDQGKIIQDGTHHDLLSSAGLYRELWGSQVDGTLPDSMESGY